MASEEPSALESEVAKSLGDVTLEQKIEHQRVQDELPQFGYDFFNAPPTTFVPVTNLPVPPDYQIGPGDTIWVPEKPDRDWYALFKDSVVILSQVATIYLVIKTSTE